MELKDIMAISGQPGLYQYVSQSRNGIIVEGLEDKKRTFVPTTARVSSLGEIAIFTDTGEVPLKDVMKKIRDKESSGVANINAKSDEAELRKYFESVLPEFDKDRVYTSDIKKVINWYNSLHKYNLLNLLDVEEKKAEDNGETKELPKAAEKKHEKPVEPRVKETKPKNVAPKQSTAAKKTGASSRKAS